MCVCLFLSSNLALNLSSDKTVPLPGSSVHVIRSLATFPLSSLPTEKSVMDDFQIPVNLRSAVPHGLLPATHQLAIYNFPGEFSCHSFLPHAPTTILILYCPTTKTVLVKTAYKKRDTQLKGEEFQVNIVTDKDLCHYMDTQRHLTKRSEQFLAES